MILRQEKTTKFQPVFSSELLGHTGASASGRLPLALLVSTMRTGIAAWSISKTSISLKSRMSIACSSRITAASEWPSMQTSTPRRACTSRIKGFSIGHIHLSAADYGHSAFNQSSDQARTPLLDLSQLCANCPSCHSVAVRAPCCVGQITCIFSRIPPRAEGRIAIVTNVRRGAVAATARCASDDADERADRLSREASTGGYQVRRFGSRAQAFADGQAVWSWRLGAGALRNASRVVATR